MHDVVYIFRAGSKSVGIHFQWRHLQWFDHGWTDNSKKLVMKYCLLEVNEKRGRDKSSPQHHTTTMMRQSFAKTCTTPDKGCLHVAKFDNGYNMSHNHFMTSYSTLQLPLP